MVDTPSVIVLRDGDTPSSPRAIGTMADESGTQYSLHVIRSDGQPVGAAAPLPTTDLVAGLALGTPTDVAWTVGSGSIVALLKAIGGFLASLVISSATSATAARQDAGNAALATIAAATGGLPAGGATAANQATGNAALGTPADAAWSGVGSSSLVAALKAVWVALTGTLTVKCISSSGTDVSGAAPVIGTILATFTVTQPGQYRVQNQSAVSLQVIFDNGAGTPTIQLLGPGSAEGAQGADTSPEMPWFVGRIRVAGSAGSQFAAMHN